MFQNYKPFILFLVRFFSSYLFVTFCYSSYLNGCNGSPNELDDITLHVGQWTQKILRFFDENASVIKNASEPSLKTIYCNTYVSRIVEGCNAVSVIILFTAFVIAFRGSLVKTILFLVLGISLIYVLNVARIVFLNILLFHFPKQEHFWHGVVFPLLIYGVVFILWVLWVNKFSFYAANTPKR